MASRYSLTTRSSRDSTRRVNSLGKLQRLAEKFGPSSPAAHSWRDFESARAEVERLRALCRERKCRFIDPWCDAAAMGPKLNSAEREWVDWTAMSPEPVLVADSGYLLADIRQGEVGDCYLLAAVASVIEEPVLLDNSACDTRRSSARYRLSRR